MARSAMRRRLLILCLCALSTAFITAAVPQTAPFDLLITGARLVDGSGNPWVRADVGVRGDRIAAIGRLAGQPAALTLDADDRVLAPGYIDVHSHAVPSFSNPTLRRADALLAQGVTSVVGNPDGGGPVDIGAQIDQLERDGLAVNVALLIGHGSVRSAVLGSANRAPTLQELDRMRALVQTAVADGAIGLSSGLFYTPGRYAKTDEVVTLAREAGRVYTSHIRDEGNYDVGVVASVDEVIRVAEEAGVRGVVSHMKALGPDSWGQSVPMLEHIEAARARGVEVFADQYPYEASSTSLAAAVMPGESGAGAKEAMEGLESRAKFLAIVKENIRRRGGPKSIVIASGRGAANRAGQSLEQIATATGATPEAVATDIVIAGGASIVSFNMSDDDIDRIMRQPWTMGSSDGGLSLPGAGQPHPRNNGAFARRIAKYVRERQVLSLEQAVRTSTSLPAMIFNLPDRGTIRVGAFADMILFDPSRVQDLATYAEPHHLAAGMDLVVVNGRVAWRDGKGASAQAGRVLRRQP